MGLSLLHFLLARLFPLQAGFVVLGVALLCAALALPPARRGLSPGLLFPLLLFLLFAFLRLGYAAEALLPPYFDSAFHYGLIRRLLEMEAGAPLRWPLQGWYHPGYHLITAGLFSFTGGSLSRVMLHFGQLLLAALPVPLYPLVRRLGGRAFAGWLAVLLAGFAWSMPAHAVDWGKYPALLGLLVFEFALGAALSGAGRTTALAALIAPLVHTRLLVLLGLAGTAWLASGARRLSRWLLPFALALLAAEVLGALRDPLLAAALKPYLVWGTLPLLPLAALAFRHSPRAALACLLALTGMLAALFLPLTPALTLLDRPLVEMALFLPLALLCGLGADRLPRRWAVLLTVLALLLSFNQSNFLPSACCRLAGPDDLAALHWLNANLPSGAVVGIASAALQISPEGEPLREAGTDAGVWVAPLTGRAAVPLPYATAFLQPGDHAQLCARGIGWLYAGSGPLSFSVPASRAYREVFALPEARLFAVDCGP